MSGLPGPASRPSVLLSDEATPRFTPDDHPDPGPIRQLSKDMGLTVLSSPERDVVKLICGAAVMSEGRTWSRAGGTAADHLQIPVGHAPLPWRQNGNANTIIEITFTGPPPTAPLSPGRPAGTGSTSGSSAPPWKQSTAGRHGRTRRKLPGERRPLPRPWPTFAPRDSLWRSSNVTAMTRTPGATCSRRSRRRRRDVHGGLQPALHGGFRPGRRRPPGHTEPGGSSPSRSGA